MISFWISRFIGRAPSTVSKPRSPSHSRARSESANVTLRDRSKDVPHHIRITVGTAEENNATLEVLSRV